MRRLSLPALSAVVLLIFSGCAQKGAPVVDTCSGKVQGVPSDTPGVTVFKGIPYAAAPVGELRWKAPQPAPAWDGILVADSFKAAAWQAAHDNTNAYTPEFFYDGDPEFNEDCLHLNIWTPAPGKPKASLPVAVWIHGGGFTGGWSFEPEMDGEAWAKKGVVLVTINYRLGLFGFLSHPLLSEESGHGTSGNYGIMDQIAALEWVKENISAFGGDPDNVTIVGQSAGARSVEALVTSDKTDGLFNKAVLMSGGGATPNTAAPNLAAIEASTKEVFDWGGYDTLEKMRQASVEELMGLQRRYLVEGGGRARITTSLVVDDYIIDQTYSSAVQKGSEKKIPYMLGFTKNDLGDRAVWIRKYADMKSEAGSPVYIYEFARPLPENEGEKYMLKGAFHSSELWYMFATLGRSPRPFVQADYDLSERMVSAWVSFCKSGNPDPSGKSGWKPYSHEDGKVMLFTLDEDCTKDASCVADPV